MSHAVLPTTSFRWLYIMILRHANIITTIILIGLQLNGCSSENNYSTTIVLLETFTAPLAIDIG